MTTTSCKKLGRTSVIELDLRQHNALRIGEELYVALPLGAGVNALVPGRCRHRGGPLHLAQRAEDATGSYLICPWHATRTRCSTLQRQALTSVQSGSSLTVVIEHTAEPPARIEPSWVAIELITATDASGEYHA